MVLNLITFASLLHKQASILGSHELILNELEKYFTVNIVAVSYTHLTLPTT